MSGGSQHNPNGRQAQLGPGWSPLQLQVANFLARAPQAHMASERGVTWHTPTPPPHLYHVPAPSPPDPLQGLLQLQAMKGANSVFRHTATPPELYRHTPTPPDKHLLRHTPSPGDVKASTALPPTELYPHLGPSREKLRPEELLAYARGAATGAAGAGAGVDLSTGTRGSANGAPPHSPHPPHPSPALSVRDAPTINSLIARAQPRHGVGRVDALLERLVPSPASPHSVIVLPRAAPTPPTPPAAPTPSPPSSNEDSADSFGAPPGSKRKRKPERTIRVSAPMSRAPSSPAAPAPPAATAPTAPALAPAPAARLSPPKEPTENGITAYEKINGPEPGTKDNPHKAPNPPNPPDPPRNAPPQPTSPSPLEPHARRKTRANSAETIDDIAAMVAAPAPRAEPLALPEDAPDSIDKLESVLASPHREDKATVQTNMEESELKPDDQDKEKLPEPQVEVAAAPKRRSARTSNAEANVPVESPSEAKPAESEVGEARTAEPTAASFVEVENQLEKMFAGIEEEPPAAGSEADKAAEPRKRRRSAPAKGETKAGRRKNRAATNDERRKGGARTKSQAKRKPKELKDAYDSGSNASSSRSRGPYIQIRGPRDSPLSVSVINASTGEEEGENVRARKGEFRNGLRARGLHASTLGLRYDATTPDATWLCAFCGRGPHAAGLGDLFGPYTADTDCEEYRALDEATRRRYSSEVWFHEACGVWAPGLVACGARVWGLASAVWGARGASCAQCARPGAQVACTSRGCRQRAHVPCAAGWRLQEDDFRAFCPRHA